MIIILLFILLLVLPLYYTHYGNKINRLPGPPGYPIVGNVLQLLCSQEKLWKILSTFNDQYYPIFKIWLFSIPIIFIRHPNDLEKILNNKKNIEKSFIYNIFKPWVNTGLFTSGGAKWHFRRKLLTPAFHFKILEDFSTILINEGIIMAKTLSNTKGPVVKDLLPFISKHTLNTICETAMGKSVENFERKKLYRKSISEMGKIIIYRMTRQWLSNEMIFSLTAKGKEQAKLLKILHGFTENIIKKRKYYYECSNDRILKSSGSDASVDDVKMIGGQKKRFALLDLLIVSAQENLLTDTDIREEIDTFMAAGHDTTAIALTYLLMLLAEHKDIQDRVRNEVNTVMQESEGKLTMKSLQNLHLLERCIKESLRLYPSAFVISRVTGEDVKLQSYVIPAGTTIFLNIYAVHRDSNFWPNPEVFDPDRFLPEKIRNRHPYSYMPFSAGPRNCIGQRYAVLQMKALAMPLIQKFYLEPVDTLANLKISIDMLLRPSNSLHIKFVPIKGC